MEKGKLLVVDGYNVLYNWGKRTRRKGVQNLPLSSDLGLKVRRLIEDLVNLRAMKGWEVNLVFDGRGNGSKEEIAGVEIIFSPSESSADALIEKIVFQNSGEKDIVVATSDYQQQKVIFRSGVRRMTPRELFSLIEDNKEELSEHLSAVKKHFIEDRLPQEVRKKLERLRKRKEL